MKLNYTFIVVFLLGVSVLSCEEESEWMVNTRVSTNQEAIASELGEINGVVASAPAFKPVIDAAGNLDVVEAGDSLNRVMEGPSSKEACEKLSLERGEAARSSASVPTKTGLLTMESLGVTKNLGSKLKLWATNYYLPVVVNGDSKSLVLKTTKEVALKVGDEVARLPEKQWCKAAMEGSVVVNFSNGKKVTFNYSGKGKSQSKCKMYKKHGTSTGKVKFKIAKSAFGEGRYYWTTKTVKKWVTKKVGNKTIREEVDRIVKVQRPYALVPFRTIAVDSKKIKPGTVIFIESAKGTKVILPNGKAWIHDGYFFAGDAGGGIKGNHVDVFTGTANSSEQPFDFIKSTSSGSFGAQVVTDSKIIKKITDQHSTSYNW